MWCTFLQAAAVPSWGPEGLESHSPGSNPCSVLMCWGTLDQRPYLPRSCFTRL